MYIKNNDHVYYRELVLGLREEYIKLQAELNAVLSNYFNDKDYTANITKGLEDETIMNIDRIKEEKDLLTVIKLLFGIREKERTLTILSCGFNNKKNYISTTDSLDMDAGTLNNLFYDVDHILSSRFVSNSFLTDINLAVNDDSYIFGMDPSGISIVADKYNLLSRCFGISYKSDLDQIQLWPYSMSYKPYAEEGSLQKMLDFKVPNDVLNPYIISTVKKNPISEASLSFEDDRVDVSYGQYFDIVTAEDGVKLKRAK